MSGKRLTGSVVLFLQPDFLLPEYLSFRSPEAAQSKQPNQTKIPRSNTRYYLLVSFKDSWESSELAEPVWTEKPHRGGEKNAENKWPNHWNSMCLRHSDKGKKKNIRRSWFEIESAKTPDYLKTSCWVQSSQHWNSMTQVSHKQMGLKVRDGHGPCLLIWSLGKTGYSWSKCSG